MRKLLVLLAVMVFATAMAVAHPKIGLILATGGLGDLSFNDQGFKGAMDAATVIAEQYGVTPQAVLDYVEPTSIAEYEGFQLQFADSGDYDVIICIGFDQASALETVAPQYPEQRFVIVDMVVIGDNIASVITNDWESAFLCGVTAGMMTETRRIGFLGGMEIPLIVRFLQGYTQGALWANPDMSEADVVARYVGDWANPTLGAELSREMYNAGVDIIYGAAGKSHLGVFAAAEENPNWWALGTDVDQALTAPEHSDVIIASGLKRVDLAVEAEILQVVDGTWEPGIRSYGIATEFGFGTGIAIGPEDINEYVRASASEVEVPCSVIVKLAEAARGIADGSIEIIID